MPLIDVPAAVDAMIAAGDFELQFSLDLTLGNGSIIHIATAPLTDVTTIDFGMVDYLEHLREPGTESESVTLASNSIDLKAQNVDSDLGETILGDEESLDGATGIFSYVFINDAGDQYQVEILHGEVVNAVDQDPEMAFTLVSHLSTDGSIGGHRTLQNACFNSYKIMARCGSASPLSQGCDHTLTGPNGCDKHLPAPRITPAETGNESSYAGFIYKQDPLPGDNLAGPTGVFDGGNDFNSYWRKHQELGDYSGRHRIPDYLV